MLLTFTAPELTESGSSTVQTVNKSSKTKGSATKTGKATKGATNTAKTTKTTKKTTKAAEKAPKEQNGQTKQGTLEERVLAVIDNLGDNMEEIKQDDLQVVDRLEVLVAHHAALEQRHPIEEEKAKYVIEAYNNLTEAIGDDIPTSAETNPDENTVLSMKAQDRVDVRDLGESKKQINEDINAARSDLEILLKDTQDLNRYITEKTSLPYDSLKSTDAQKQKSINAFLLQTLQNSDENNMPIYKENEVLKRKADDLRVQVLKQKFDGFNSINMQDIYNMGFESKHAEIFKGLDAEANRNVDEFGKHGDLWKRLFAEGMEFERKCDDVDYDIRDLSDQEAQTRRTKADLESAYADYVGKLRYINEQQKGTIDELKNKINESKSDISDLRRQHDNASADLTIESKAFARGRNTKDDPNLENLTNDVVGVHQERRRAQDEGENLHDDWVGSTRVFLDKSNSEYEAGQRDRGTLLRIQDIMAQIAQSNEDIERLIAELQRLEREKAINGHRGTVSNDITVDLTDVRSRLDKELAKRERIIVELKDFTTQQRSKSDVYGRQREEIDILIRDIEELREFLREKYEDEEAELLELEREIENHKTRLRDIINEINELRVLIIEEEHHNDIKRNLLRNRDEYIERLKIALKELNKKPVKKIEYIVVQGDDVDALLADAMRKYGVSIPLTRLGGGFYLFGTRKIYAKIMNGKLVVRVGGGYMVIDEFLATYSDMELIRINKMLEKEDVDAYEELKVYKKYKEENPEAFKKIDPRKRTLIKSPTSKMKPSERGRF